MGQLKETLEKQGLELRSDKGTACCPTPERTDKIREQMTQFVKWMPNGLMILGRASASGYRTEIKTEARENHEPTCGSVQNARIPADRITRTCEAEDALLLLGNCLPLAIMAQAIFTRTLCVFCDRVRCLVGGFVVLLRSRRLSSSCVLLSRSRRLSFSCAGVVLAALALERFLVRNGQ